MQVIQTRRGKQPENTRMFTDNSGTFIRSLQSTRNWRVNEHAPQTSYSEYITWRKIRTRIMRWYRETSVLPRTHGNEKALVFTTWKRTIIIIIQHSLLDFLYNEQSWLSYIIHCRIFFIQWTISIKHCWMCAQWKNYN